MLHTLNRAWVKILAKHANKPIILVYKSFAESEMIVDTVTEVYKELGEDDNKLFNMWVVNENDIKEYIELCEQGFSNFGMYDDILVSHEIHDCMLLDYLGRHCKRMCC